MPMKTNGPFPPPFELPEEQGFRFQHGPLARNLREFATALSQAPVHVVHDHRAHYAPWVRACLRDEPLARRLEAYADQGSAPDVYRDIVVALVARRAAEGSTPS